MRACEDVVACIRDTLTDLQRLAFLGHEGIVEGTRERSLHGYPYVVVYRVDIDMKRGDSRCLSGIETEHKCPTGIDRSYNTLILLMEFTKWRPVGECGIAVRPTT